MRALSWLSQNLLALIVVGAMTYAIAAATPTYVLVATNGVPLGLESCPKCWMKLSLDRGKEALWCHWCKQVIVEHPPEVDGAEDAAEW